MPVSRNRPATPPSSPPALLCPPPPEPSTISFQTPTRKLITPSDLALFQASPTHELLLSFITDLNNSILNTPTTSKDIKEVPFITSLLALLENVRKTISEFPPEESASRFGNKSFQAFYDAVWERSAGWHEGLGIPGGAPAVDEAKRYFCECWGNRTRIDYGSGHELNFVSWLLCLRQLGLLPPEAYPSAILRLFTSYIAIMCELQTTYYLEPAGSHGVWGLDDYQFLPFLFGSSQLYSHPYILPKSIHNADILETYSSQYLYLSSISFINSIKTTASLRWHSPMLDDISGARNWKKINEGMLKMWKDEVLGKLPIMQHFMFGGILQAVEGMGEGQDEDREGMRHVHSGWGECCGIKVPAAVAARKVEEGSGLRSVGRIPFD